MYISIVNISKMVTDRTNITIAIKYEIADGLSKIIFRYDLTNFKVQLGHWNGVAKYIGLLVSSANRHLKASPTFVYV